ncbi:MAG: hypothetical protein ACD_80C00013G0003 [uncultured bacterium (gcode 4)]|uniref:DUF304 domain-containing protein n=1 Tax=uncultured bacterium (gcode 4) TaxID=1234023 RepID=K1XZ18_9BACT|nr:MAG: hypothetical protein ACD_80C00013G0003 [uncultured bacterium (gcode 4)]
MRIFSNFDTKLRQKTFQEYQQKYGHENVICFWRSKLYRMYKVISPLLGVILFTILGLMFFYRWLHGDYFNYIIAIILIADIMFLFPVIDKFIDYKMDFIVVIPNAIMMYDQGALFRRNIKTISTQSIKAIAIQKSSLLYSIFDNGDLIILSEGDSEHEGEMILRWIPRPEKRRNQIVKIIGLDLKANQNPKI